MRLFVLSLLCLLQVWPSSSRFVFEFQLLRVDVLDDENCDNFAVGQEARGRCEPFLSDFCLREGRNTQLVTTEGLLDDCPLGHVPEFGRVVAYTPADLSRELETRPGLPDGPVNRTIMSEEPWPGTFQLYIPVRELDPAGPNRDVSLDDIFINRALAVSAYFTPIETYIGINTMNNRVILDMRFRVMCQQDYYGANCTSFCIAQNDSVNGYYTCNSDGSIQCQEGLRNTDDNCTEVIPACESSPCANGGNCTSMGPFDFTCQCAVGYTGSTCEVNINDCVSVTCPSNSVCVDGINGFVCVCLRGFERINNTCVMMLQTESNINAACELSPCGNHGNCTSMGPFDFTCQCEVGYTGSTCEVNIDDCVSATCPCNSICVDGVDNFECTCLPGFGKINGTCVMMIQTESCNAVCYSYIIPLAASAALIIGILIVVIIVLSVVVIKGRKPHHGHQCSCQGLDGNIETKPNEVYGLPRPDQITGIEMKPNEVYGLSGL